jgi:hypothetical protein
MTRTLCRSLAVAATVALAPYVNAGDLHAFYETAPGGNLKLTAQLSEAAGPGWALLAHVGGDEFIQARSIIVEIGPLDQDGFGKLEYVFPDTVLPLPEALWVSMAAVYKDGPVVFTPQADLVLGKELGCEGLDFNFTLGHDDEAVMVAGRVVDEQWADVGMHISADNKDVEHPDKAILFDTSNPTGGDDDLGVGLGMGLIIAEDDEDLNGDGIVDDPDDEMKGGSIFFDFDVPATVCRVRLIDIDETPGTQLRFYRDGDLVTPTDAMTIISLGDGAIQDVFTHEEQVDRLEVFFKGSGLVGGADLIVCPQFIDFNETTLGQPLTFVAGQEITDEFEHLGVHISALNDGIAQGFEHPDKAILFDSANPTGGDFDLMTPNPDNPSNNEALGFVFIIAEDDWDGNNDGIVDDPDDEMFGGEIRFDFDWPVTFESAAVLDCDENEIDWLRCYDKDGVELAASFIPDEPDGSVQHVEVMTSGVRRVVFDLGGSGAVTRIRFCPDPVGDE